jgi:hypothetical protein
MDAEFADSVELAFGCPFERGDRPVERGEDVFLIGR